MVEDRPVMRAMLREFVQNAFPSCTIVDVASGARALELCAEQQPELVLMDLNLPDADGIDLTARIRAQWPQVRVIVVSYQEGQTYMDRANAAGAHAYVLKDHLVMDLVPAIADALGVAPAGPARPTQ
jgi:DNA-binding NarL/FixJ family response regulator